MITGPLEPRLQFAYGLLYDAGRWLEQIVDDVPQLRDTLDQAVDAIRQAQGHVEQAKMDARLKQAMQSVIVLALDEDLATEESKP